MPQGLDRGILCIAILEINEHSPRLGNAQGAVKAKGDLCWIIFIHVCVEGDIMVIQLRASDLISW